jgi:hypothetical protein
MPFNRFASEEGPTLDTAVKIRLVSVRTWETSTSFRRLTSSFRIVSASRAEPADRFASTRDQIAPTIETTEAMIERMLSMQVGRGARLGSLR